MPTTKQLSNQQLIWCRRVARKIWKAYQRYLRAVQLLLGSRGIIELPATAKHKNSIEDAYTVKATWEEFVDSLSEEERAVIDYITDGYGDYWTKEEMKLLKRINRMGKNRGLW